MYVCRFVAKGHSLRKEQRSIDNTVDITLKDEKVKTDALPMIFISIIFYCYRVTIRPMNLRLLWFILG